MSSIFTKIIQGDIPCYKIAEDDAHIAFLDINPLVRGHVLVVPKHEVDYIFDIDADELASLMKFAQKVASSIKSKINCKRVAVMVFGLDVPHAHIHLVPLNTMADADFTKAKLKLTDEEFRQIATLLKI
ncbi:MAG: HIT family protein [Mucinivorans sp.]